MKGGWYPLSRWKHLRSSTGGKGEGTKGTRKNRKRAKHHPMSLCYATVYIVFSKKPQTNANHSCV